jgi:hypothetical protein
MKGTIMRARAFFNTPKKVMLPGAVIGATYRPDGFYDLASWRLVIDDEGNLLQEIATAWQGTLRQEQVHIGQDAVLELLLQAESLGFYKFLPSYQAGISNRGRYFISIRFGELDVSVDAYGADWMATEEHDEMKRFMQLWNAIHQFAPFRST